MTAPTTSQLPDPPQRRDASSTFDAKADAFLGALPTFGTEINTVSTFVDARASETQSNADAAASAAATAAASANYKGPWSSLTGALNIPASVTHNNVMWLLTQNLADVTAAEPGVSAAWETLIAVGVTRFRVIVTATSISAQARDLVVVTASGRTITLPASPTAGDEIAIAVVAFTDTIVNPNGQPIMSTSGNMTVDYQNYTVTMVYVDATRGWRIV